MARPFAPCGGLRSGPQSQPIAIQKCSELSPPNVSERPTSNLSDSSRRDCPFFPPFWISSEVCSGCHTRHADAGFLTKVDLACLPAGLVATAEDRLTACTH